MVLLLSLSYVMPIGSDRSQTRRSCGKQSFRKRDGITATPSTSTPGLSPSARLTGTSFQYFFSFLFLSVLVTVTTVASVHMHECAAAVHVLAL